MRLFEKKHLKALTPLPPLPHRGRGGAVPTCVCSGSKPRFAGCRQGMRCCCTAHPPLPHRGRGGAVPTCVCSGSEPRFAGRRQGMRCCCTAHPPLPRGGRGARGEGIQISRTEKSKGAHIGAPLQPTLSVGADLRVCPSQTGRTHRCAPTADALGRGRPACLPFTNRAHTSVRPYSRRSR
ncbi:MAG: hypothetical protein KatS3mg019_1354 [Fimbriimonadales bacterium]|nr:MAG: hypothetical protein KatS3mg019_1354 [Fimbriimonadales bacterium]